MIGTASATQLPAYRQAIVVTFYCSTRSYDGFREVKERDRIIRQSFRARYGCEGHVTGPELN